MGIITVNKNGGSSNQTFEEYYNIGTIIELEDLTKVGYTFTGWEIINGLSVLSGKTLTIGSTDTTIRGTFELASYTCAGGTYLKKGEASCSTCPMRSSRR